MRPGILRLFSAIIALLYAIIALLSPLTGLDGALTLHRSKICGFGIIQYG